MQQVATQPPKNEEIKLPEESKVGKKLGDLTTRKVILMVLAMLFSVPIFTVTTYLDTYTGYGFGLELLSNYEVGTEAFNIAYESYV